MSSRSSEALNSVCVEAFSTIQGLVNFFGGLQPSSTRLDAHGFKYFKTTHYVLKMEVNSLLAAPMALIRQAVAADTQLDFMRAIDLYEEGISSLQEILSSPAGRMSQSSQTPTLISQIHDPIS